MKEVKGERPAQKDLWVRLLATHIPEVIGAAETGLAVTGC